MARLSSQRKLNLPSITMVSELNTSSLVMEQIIMDTRLKERKLIWLKQSKQSTSETTENSKRNPSSSQMITLLVSGLEKSILMMLASILSILGLMMVQDFGSTVKRLLKTGVFMEQDRRVDKLILQQDGTTSRPPISRMLVELL
jgi:hypothetical protein